MEYTCPLEDEHLGVFAQHDYVIHVLIGKKKWKTVHGEWEVGADMWVNDTVDAALIYGSFEAVYFTSENTGVIGSWNIYGLVKTNDGGANWVDVSGSASPDLYSIDFANEFVGFAVGLGGIIMTTVDGGDTRTTETFPSIGSLNAVQALSSTVVVAIGGNGKIVKNVQATSGLSELNEHLSFTAYPNPFETNFTVEIPTAFNAAQITITDVSGKVVFTQLIFENNALVSVHQLEAGTYSVILDVDGALTTRLVVI